jgi:hypothetical protein
LKAVKSGGYCSSMVATPSTDAAATVPTPTSSPTHIQAVRRTPTVIPRLSESIMHMPGVSDTRKKVSRKSENVAEVMVEMAFESAPAHMGPRGSATKPSCGKCRPVQDALVYCCRPTPDIGLTP